MSFQISKIFYMYKYILSIFLLFSFSSNSYAGKLDILFGAYSSSGQGSGKTTSLSGLGSFEMSYLIPIREKFEVSLGYNYTIIGGITSDYSYGPKLGVNYFPFNFSSSEKIILPNTTIDVNDFFKPYVGLNFNQKQFVSNKTFFAGFGVAAGFEKYISPQYTVKAEIKYKALTGSSESSLNEINLLGGLVIVF